MKRIAIAVLLTGCLNTDPPEGVLVCATAADCPDDWVCVELRCYRSEQSEDAGRDPDAGVDAGRDGGTDGGRDAGGDADTTDAGMCDAVESGSCADGEDQDCDGDTDCADEDCAGDTACGGCTVDNEGSVCNVDPRSLCRGGECVLSTCGDGFVDSTEDCEDGNTVAGDGCEPVTCRYSCVSASECTALVCRDAACTENRCVDGGARPDGEACGAGGVCMAGACVTPGCGDGTVGTGETCDTAIPAGMPGECPTTCDDGDACTIDAVIGAGSCAAACDSMDPPCASGDGCCPLGCTGASDLDCPNVCGDGRIADGETCDDDNTASSDGCSITCQVEANFACAGEPSVCTCLSPVGAPCCTMQLCGPGGACRASVCEPCGEATQLCCAGRACNGALFCDAANTCQSCGGTDLGCCPGDVCNVGLTCRGGTCTPPCTGQLGASPVVISEYATRGPNGGTDEFLELYNESSTPFDLSGFTIRYTSGGGSMGPPCATILVGTQIQPGAYFLVASNNFSYVTIAPDARHSCSGWADAAGTLELRAPDGLSVIDQVGWGTAVLFEGMPTSSSGFAGVASNERKAQDCSTSTTMASGADETRGNGHDTENNANDFVRRYSPEPQNSLSPPEVF